MRFKRNRSLLDDGKNWVDKVYTVQMPHIRIVSLVKLLQCEKSDNYFHEQSISYKSVGLYGV